MRLKKNSVEVLRLRKTLIHCKNCGKFTNKFRFGSYKEVRKFCCHKCSADYHKKHGVKGKKHHLWKGKDASYITQHQWINRNYGKANKCEHCNIKNANRYHWANISGKYKRNVSDYKQLCVSCHGKYNHLQKYGDKCRKGHPRLPENLRRKKNGEWKECAICRIEKYKQHQLKSP